MTEDLFRHLRTHVGNKRMDEKIIAQEMKELDERQQLLVITMEECGELIQECSKNLRRNSTTEIHLRMRSEMFTQ